MSATDVTRVAVRGAETVSTRTLYNQRYYKTSILSRIYSQREHALCNALKERLAASLCAEAGDC